MFCDIRGFTSLSERIGPNPLGEGGESANVAEHDARLHGLGIATGDVPIEDFWAGRLSEVDLGDLAGLRRSIGTVERQTEQVF